LPSLLQTQFPRSAEDEDDDEADDVLDDEDVWNDLQEEDQVQVDATVSTSCKRRLSCFAHSLQLAVGDGLKETGRYV
jgi:hypothetical protein